MSDVLSIENPRDGVKILRMNRPDKLNALDLDLAAALHREFDALASDRTTRVVVLTGAGRGFCAGLDLDGYGDIPGTEEFGEVHRTLARQQDIASLVQKIRRLPQVFVAAVNGPAAGGGFALVCASDVRIAAESAVFAVSFIKVGFSGCDIGTSWLLPRIVGAGRAHELMLTARKFGSDEAVRIGLLADVVPDDALAGRIDTCVSDLLAAPPLSLALTKRGMWLSLEMPSFDTAVEFENRQQVLTSVTADQSEAMTAFVEKRSPIYENR
ncbi:enoyl-CoA hydratase/isomerase family protein [Rhodococcus artemisiae]|uniref:Enoyl-CoA hydratase/isomerase family protein n=1 Tax=Rhodococcus artemisiae TaxID=714159 RepID=A0ABU7L7F7_9NOCA|nr:enoyl-CoA hydratase/isomerase family protein [Rhodococcus artemisiae]MEE2057254.1 enoyl-CoA hydratase/isomerase family protein [Rhodococcus artemisiae]